MRLLVTIFLLLGFSLSWAATDIAEHAADAGAAHGEESGNPVAELAGKFKVKTPILLAQIANFCIVAFLIWKFAYKPVIETMDERQKRIEDGLQYAEEMKSRLSEAEKSKAETLKDAQLEAQKIVKEARDHAQAAIEKGAQEAISKADGIIKKGNEALVQERQKMLSEVRQEIATLVVQTTGKVLRKELGEDEKQKLSDSAAKELAGAN